MVGIESGLIDQAGPQGSQVIPVEEMHTTVMKRAQLRAQKMKGQIAVVFSRPQAVASRASSGAGMATCTEVVDGTAKDRRMQPLATILMSQVAVVLCNQAILVDGQVVAMTIQLSALVPAILAMVMGTAIEAGAVMAPGHQMHSGKAEVLAEREPSATMHALMAVTVHLPRLNQTTVTPQKAKGLHLSGALMVVGSMHMAANTQIAFLMLVVTMAIMIVMRSMQQVVGLSCGAVGVVAAAHTWSSVGVRVGWVLRRQRGMVLVVMVLLPPGIEGRAGREGASGMPNVQGAPATSSAAIDVCVYSSF